jgi:hypothetical protein
MQPMSRALRPGVQDTAAPKKPSFDLGTMKGPKAPSMAPPKMGKGMKMNTSMKPPPFKGRPSPRGK